MNTLAFNPKIAATFESVRKFSYEEKKEVMFDDTKVNSFLDKIVAFKTILSTKTTKINIIVDSIEQITWLNNLDDEALFLINDLIASVKDLRSSLLRQYVSLHLIKLKGIAIDEIKNFKTAIDDLKEIANDLESAFFFLPNIKEFKETTKALSLVK